MGLGRQKNGRRFDHQRVVDGGYARCRDESHDLDLHDLDNLDLHNGSKELHNCGRRGRCDG